MILQESIDVTIKQCRCGRLEEARVFALEEQTANDAEVD
jgi:hypothetical protein